MPGPSRVVVNLRGANAAGKTTLARLFLAHQKSSTSMHLPDGNGKPNEILVYRCEVPGLVLPVYALGRYDGGKYDGCDRVKSKDVIQEAVRACAAAMDGHILFEGFYVSKSWVPYVDLRREVLRANPGLRWLWAFLHAPEALIFERSEARRALGSRPIDRKELGGVVRQMANSRANAMALFPPEEVLTLNPARAPEELYEQLVERMAELEAGGA